MFVPRTNSQGLLTEDFLLVTRLRNYLSSEALGEGKFLISIGGTHGTATRALELLLTDKGVLQLIAQKLSGHPASYQILLRVGDIDHNQAKGSTARKIEIVGEPVILEEDPQRWRTANLLVRGEFEAWAKVKKDQDAQP